MNKSNGLVHRIKIGLVIVLSAALLVALLGCVGYAGGGYCGTVLVPGPEVYVFGGSYGRGRDVHEYSHRGYESRAAAYPVGGGPEGRPLLRLARTNGRWRSHW